MNKRPNREQRMTRVFSKTPTCVLVTIYDSFAAPFPTMSKEGLHCRGIIMQILEKRNRYSFNAWINSEEMSPGPFFALGEPNIEFDMVDGMEAA